MVDRRLALDIELFSRGGMRVLEKIEAQDYDVLSRRPSDFENRARVAAAGHAGARGVVAGGVMADGRPNRTTTAAAVARSRAKNFYYSFVLLPREQRNAMCAIYAFMRYCDDLSDEPGASHEPLERWRARWRMRSAASSMDIPPGRPFIDTVRRFGIPHEYFLEMIDGVISDLEPRRFETFDELYRYCYQVASVVGLTIIHIFGFDSPARCRWPRSAALRFS